jgi:hypothetical protein
MDDRPYKVFLSHGADDGWIARQLAKEIHKVGADSFLDSTNIPKGADFKRIIHREIAASSELLALFTPWSAKRSWVWIEIGAAWGQGKPVVAVFYGMNPKDLDDSGQGKAILEDINVMNIDEVDSYLTELAERANGGSDA